MFIGSRVRADVSADTVIDALAARAARFDPVAYRLEIRVRKTHDGKPVPLYATQFPDDADGTTRLIYEYRRDGLRLDLVSLRDPLKTAGDDVRDPERHLKRLIVDNDNRVVFLNHTHADHTASIMRQPMGTTAPEVIAKMLDGSTFGACALDGREADAPLRPLADALRTSTSKTLAPDPADPSKLLLTCETPDAAYALRCDPSLGNQPIEVHRTRRDAGTPGTDVVVSQMAYAGRGVDAYPVAATVTMRTTDAKGVTEVHNRVTRGEASFAPDFARLDAFVMRAPLDSDVSDIEHPGVAYALRDGKYVPATKADQDQRDDAALSAAAARVDVAPSPSERPARSRGIVLSVGCATVIVVLVAALAAARRRRNARRSPD